MTDRGTVKWFNETKGFGFITPDVGEGDLFVHFKAIRSEGFKTLKEMDKVEYTAAKGAKGMEARDVSVIRD